jgi:prolipoprotein diacylglyceryltransferase
VIVHSIFDVLAWLAGGTLGWWVRRVGLLSGVALPTLTGDPAYFIVLPLGAIVGAVALGSLNLGLAGLAPLGHSIAGALVGGIVAVEALKLVRGTRRSTGLGFVAPLALGIAVGRLGCFFAGLPDYTYGTATALPWSVDFGDGISRHPVQLYESLAMLIFLGVFLAGLRAQSPLILRHGFYLFVAWYAAQRFAWEFLKPYPRLLGPLNLFHLACLALLIYSAFMMRRNHELIARG